MLIWEEWMHRNNMAISYVIGFIAYAFVTYCAALFGEASTRPESFSANFLLLADITALFIAKRYWQNKPILFFSLLTPLLVISLWLVSTPLYFILASAGHVLTTALVFYFALEVKKFEERNTGLKYQAFVYGIGLLAFIGTGFMLSWVVSIISENDNVPLMGGGISKHSHFVVIFTLTL